MKINVCERCNSESVGKKKGNNKNHKCIHMFNYTSEKSYKMVSPNVNLGGRGKKKKKMLNDQGLKESTEGKLWPEGPPCTCVWASGYSDAKCCFGASH